MVKPALEFSTGLGLPDVRIPAGTGTEFPEPGPAREKKKKKAQRLLLNPGPRKCKQYLQSSQSQSAESMWNGSSGSKLSLQSDPAPMLGKEMVRETHRVHRSKTCRNGQPTLKGIRKGRDLICFFFCFFFLVFRPGY